MHARQLTVLCFRNAGNNLGLPGAKQLATLLADSSLKLLRLDLRHNNLGLALLCCVGARRREHAAGLPSPPALRPPLTLEGVRGGRGCAGNEGCVALAEALCDNKTLQRIDLSANGPCLRPPALLARPTPRDPRARSREPACLGSRGCSRS
eukprot:1150706-Rhodomonas_salina.1